MTALSKEVLIDEIIRDALGNLADWSKPVALPSVGPKFPELGDQFNEDIQSIKQELREMLNPLSVEILTSRHKEDNYNRTKTLRDPKGVEFHMVAKIATLMRRKPAWFIAGWHIKELELDVPHWRAFSRSNLVELTVMSVGLDPRKVAYDPLFKHYGRSTEQDTMLYFLEDQFEAIANGLALDPEDEYADTDMEEFFRWTKRVKFRVDDRFRRLLREKYGDASADKADTEVERASPTQKPKALHKSSYNFHAQLLYAMAVEKFGEISSHDLGRTAKKIQAIAEFQGQTPSLNPIKQLLIKGHELSYDNKLAVEIRR